MGITQFDTLDVSISNAKVAAAVPGTPMAYYGFTAGQDAGNREWVGGELLYLSTDGKLYVQTATSGSGAGTWYKTTDAFVTTTSTSTSSSSTSTSTTSSSTSSSTSTSTTSSSTTSTSSTTTAP